MNKIKTIMAALAGLLAPIFTPVRTMANALDHRAMLLKLLGCANEADDDMVNTRYNAAMAAEPDEDDKKMLKANEKLTADLAAANTKLAAAVQPKPVKVTIAGEELSITCANDADPAAVAAVVTKVATKIDAATQAKATAETAFANERKERVKLLLDQAVTANRITGAERTAFEGEFANAATFDATIAKLSEKKGAALPNGRQTGDLGSRRAGLTTSTDKARRDKIATFVNEEMAKPAYASLAGDVKYSRAFNAVMVAHPELSVVNS